MSDQTDGTLDFKELAKIAGLAIFANRGMVTDSKIDPYKIADVIEPTVVGALVTVEGDRGDIGVTPTRLMVDHFPEVPRQDQAQTEDVDELELIDLTYEYVKAEVFRTLNISPQGPIQQRLARNGNGLVLCRMKGRRGAEEVAYVTRNKKCIHEDNNGPAYKAAALALARATALTGMSIERVPEAKKWFERQHKTATRESLNAGDNVIQLALEMTNGGSGDEAAGDE